MEHIKIWRDKLGSCSELDAKVVLRLEYIFFFSRSFYVEIQCVRAPEQLVLSHEG